jgi:hypothetical protein
LAAANAALSSPGASASAFACAARAAAASPFRSWKRAAKSCASGLPWQCSCARRTAAAAALAWLGSSQRT